MNPDLNPIEEQALDTLLAETLGQSTPPDLSKEILAQLSNDASTSGIQVASNQVASSQSEAQSTGRAGSLVAIFAGIAASIALVAWLASNNADVDDPGMVTAENTPDRLAEPDAKSNVLPPSAVATNDQPPTELPKTQQSVRPPTKVRGVPMVVRSQPQSQPSEISPTLSETHSPSLRRRIELVSQQIETNFSGYWDAIGICLLYTSPSPRDQRGPRMPSSA